MRFDRAAAGLSGAAILVVVALAPGGLAVMEIVLLVVAGLVILATFAPQLPLLHGLPIVGAPRVAVYFEATPLPDAPQDVVLRVGIHNAGPRRVEGALINLLVADPVEIHASDWSGNHVPRGSSMGPTDIDGQPARFWADDELTLPVGDRQLHYRLTLPAQRGAHRVRVLLGSDDLHGHEDRVFDYSISRS